REFVVRTHGRRQAGRAAGTDSAVCEIDPLAVQSRQRNVWNAPRRIDLDAPIGITLREQTIADAIPLTRVPRQCDEEVLHAPHGDARRAGAVDLVAARIGLSIDQDRGPDEANPVVVRIKPQTEITSGFAIAVLWQEAEVGAECLAEIDDERAGVVALLVAVPRRKK